MPHNDFSQSQLNTDDQRVDLAAWLQLEFELELDPAPVLVLAAAPSASSPWAVVPLRCPMCGAAVAGAGGRLHCANCGMEIDL